MKQRDFTSAKAKEALLPDKEKYCGNCSWFCHEDTDGWGQCLRQELCDSMNCSDLCTTDEYVSRQQMRHHMAVLLQRLRFQKDNDDSFHPKRKFPFGVFEAMEFAYKYMKVFSKL